jgi:hypothetical protein
MQPRTKNYASENVLEEFYKALADEDEGRLRRVHIPRSDVFYVREAIFNGTGVWYTLDRVERSMYLEGMLEKGDVLDPDRVRDWEIGGLD